MSETTARGAALKYLKLGSVSVSCATAGIGIGMIQGAIVARSAATDEMLVFAGTAGLVGGVIALFLGPILYYALKRRVSLEEFCVIVTLSLLAGAASAFVLSIDPNGPGWASMFVTPLAAISLAIRFSRGRSTV